MRRAGSGPRSCSSRIDEATFIEPQAHVARARPALRDGMAPGLVREICDRHIAEVVLRGGNAQPPWAYAVLASVSNAKVTSFVMGQSGFIEIVFGLRSSRPHLLVPYTS